MSTKLADWCPNCQRLTYLKDDGLTFINHYDRGGRRCLPSNKIEADWETPQWLSVLAEVNAAGRFPPRWTLQQAADHLGLRTTHARKVLRENGCFPVTAVGWYRYDPLDVEDVRVQREHEQKIRDQERATAPQRQKQAVARWAKRGRAARYAARELVDGRLVATKVSEHGSASTYSNHGCRCQPCAEANIRRMQEYSRARQSQSPG